MTVAVLSARHSWHILTWSVLIISIILSFSSTLCIVFMNNILIHSVSFNIFTSCCLLWHYYLSSLSSKQFCIVVHLKRFFYWYHLFPSSHSIMSLGLWEKPEQNIFVIPNKAFRIIIPISIEFATNIYLTSKEKITLHLAEEYNQTTVP